MGISEVVKKECELCHNDFYVPRGLNRVTPNTCPKCIKEGKVKIVEDRKELAYNAEYKVEEHLAQKAELKASKPRKSRSKKVMSGMMMTP